MRADVEAGWYAGTDPRDKNPTMDGVTQNTYDRWRKAQGKPKRTVQKLEAGERDSIYRVLYWTKGRCDDLAKRSDLIALIHFDACVNHGIGSPNNDQSAGATELLQRALQVDDDGIFGPKTWENYVHELMEDGEVILGCRYIKVREAQYKHLADKAPNTLGLNLKGWLNRLVKLRVYLGLPEC